ncbi:replicative DNA helicase [Hyphomonas sp.]|uniref:replicative DNA helicase n=1 Tax=Hyphomonas sp. TaxID=87 RepID=UPI0025BFD930|nr:replicative DNA helicase [Hyphomonas sp.]
MNQQTTSQTPVVSPHNLAAEAAVLGAILFDNNVYQYIADILRPIDFYAPAHSLLYEVASNMIQTGRVADGVTLREHFEQKEKLTEIGGGKYLVDLLDAAAFGPEVKDYARIIRDLAIRRELIRVGASIQSQSLVPEDEDTGSTLINKAERALFELAERGSSERGFSSFAEALAESLITAEAAFKRGGKIAGIPTALRDLDEQLGGFHRSDLLILAGRPSMGKTSLATNIAYNVAKAYKYETLEDGSHKTIDGGIVAFFSLEMSSEQLATRILAERTEISSHDIRQGKLSKADFERLSEATAEMQNLPLYIDDTGGISIGELTARARRLRRSVGLDLIVIDYLQLITASSSGSNVNRVQEVTQITTALKALAKDLNVPVMALSQLSRAVEQRDDKRPQLSDLRESGSIEQDADIVMFVFREEYYLARTEPPADPNDPSSNDKWKAWRTRMDQVFGTAEVIVSKQRHGPIGTVKLAFDARVTRFGNLEYDASKADPFE